MSLFKEYIKKKVALEKAIVVSPDFGGLKRARLLADELDLNLANIDKHRDLSTGKVTPMGVTGAIEGKICLIYDDVINTGSTVIEVAKFLKSHGAKEVHFFVAHALFAQNGVTMMTDESINSVVITNSIHHKELPEKIIVLDTAEIFVKALKTWM